MLVSFSKKISFGGKGNPAQFGQNYTALSDALLTEKFFEVF